MTLRRCAEMPFPILERPDCEANKIGEICWRHRRKRRRSLKKAYGLLKRLENHLGIIIVVFTTKPYIPFFNRFRLSHFADFVCENHN
jgi:hypothetical protein